MSPGLLALFALLLIPLLLLLIFYKIVTVSFVRLGIPRAVVGLLFVAILAGSLVNIPLWAVADDQTVTLLRWENILFLDPPSVGSTIIAANVGGAIIPVLLTLWLLPRAPLFRTVVAVVIVTAIAFALSDVVPGQGIMINALIPPAVSAVTAMALAWRQAAPVAYIAGVTGTLVGADFLHLPELLETDPTYLSIGGAGIFDGIFLVGLIAALLSPGERRVRRKQGSKTATGP